MSVIRTDGLNVPCRIGLELSPAASAAKQNFLTFMPDAVRRVRLWAHTADGIKPAARARDGVGAQCWCGAAGGGSAGVACCLCIISQ